MLAFQKPGRGWGGHGVISQSQEQHKRLQAPILMLAFSICPLVFAAGSVMPHKSPLICSFSPLAFHREAINSLKVTTGPEFYAGRGSSETDKCPQPSRTLSSTSVDSHHPSPVLRMDNKCLTPKKCSSDSSKPP